MSANDTAAFVFLCVFGLPVAGWILVRLMQYSERMAMIKRGMTPPGYSQPGWGGHPSPGAGLSPPGAVPWRRSPQGQLARGITVTMIGAALLIGLSFIGGTPGNGWVPGPWLLGGLIPMFVGLSQIISAMIAGAQFPRGTPIAPPPGSQRYEQTYQPPPAAPGGPYAYRPPGDKEELPRSHPPQNP